MKRAVTSVLAGALALACHKVEEPPSRATAERAVADPAPEPARADSCCTCDLSARVDLAAARSRPLFQLARQQLLAGDSGATFLALSRSTGVDLMEAGRDASICEVTNTGGKPRPLLRIVGDFPDDLLERASRTNASAVLERAAKAELLHVGAGWFALEADVLAWSDSRDGVERALHTETFDSGLNPDALLSVRMSRRRATAAYRSLATVGREGDSPWDTVRLEVGRDGLSTELRFFSETPADTGRLLEDLRSAVTNIQKNLGGRPSAARGLTAEASEGSVALRDPVPLEQFVPLLAAIGQPPEDHH